MAIVCVPHTQERARGGGGLGSGGGVAEGGRWRWNLMHVYYGCFVRLYICMCVGVPTSAIKSRR